ncbi:MAG: DUF308 domain-containing protein [Eubacterium sp.]|nr:DUF308 domain-containing protein [Eubacterium sp.]
MELIKKVKTISIASLILACALGIIFIAFPAQVMTYISLFIGGAMIIVGIAAIINYFRTHAPSFVLMTGVFTAILGVVVCTKYEAIIRVLVILLGVFLLTSGLVNLYAAIKVIAASFFLGWVTLFLAVATSVLGIVAITKSDSFSVKLVQFIGVALIVYAVLEIFAYISVKAIYKDVKEVVDDAADSVRNAAERINEAASVIEADDSEAIETTGSIVDDFDNAAPVEVEGTVVDTTDSAPDSE